MVYFDGCGCAARLQCCSSLDPDEFRWPRRLPILECTPFLVARILTNFPGPNASTWVFTMTNTPMSPLMAPEHRPMHTKQDVSHGDTRAPLNCREGPTHGSSCLPALLLPDGPQSRLICMLALLSHIQRRQRRYYTTNATL